MKRFNWIEYLNRHLTDAIRHLDDLNRYLGDKLVFAGLNRHPADAEGLVYQRLDDLKLI